MGREIVGTDAAGAAMRDAGALQRLALAAMAALVALCAAFAASCLAPQPQAEAFGGYKSGQNIKGSGYLVWQAANPYDHTFYVTIKKGDLKGSRYYATCHNHNKATPANGWYRYVATYHKSSDTFTVRLNSSHAGGLYSGMGQTWMNSPGTQEIVAYVSAPDPAGLHIKVVKKSDKDGDKDGDYQKRQPAVGAKFKVYGTKREAKKARSGKDPKALATIVASKKDKSGAAYGTSKEIKQTKADKTYYVVETKAPKGYRPSKDIKEIKVRNARAGKEITKTATFKDKPYQMDIKVQKKASVDKWPLKLDGGKFKVYDNRKDAVRAWKTAREQIAKGKSYSKYKGKLPDGALDTLTTDKKGKAKSDATLAFDTYYVVEVKAPRDLQLATSKKAAIEKVSADVDHGDKDNCVKYGDFTNKPKPHRLSVRKKSANTGITRRNACYSFKGALFGVYRSEADAKAAAVSKDGKAPTDKKRVALLAADKDGNTGKAQLANGTYWVRELWAPTGYRIASKPQKAVLSPGGGNESVTFADEPLADVANITLQKRDSETGLPRAAGDATLDGAVFAVRFYAGIQDVSRASGNPTRTWYIRTKADADGVGRAELDEEHLVKSGIYNSRDLYRNSKGKVVIPVGVMTIREVAAPKGYEVDNRTYLFTVNPSGKFNAASGIAQDFYNTAKRELAVQEQASHGWDYAFPKVWKKLDGTTGPMAGMEFAIINRSDGAVTSPVDGRTQVAPGGRVCTVTTDALGNASTRAGAAVNGWAVPAGWQGALGVGTYEVHELRPFESDKSRAAEDAWKKANPGSSLAYAEDWTFQLTGNEPDGSVVAYKGADGETQVVDQEDNRGTLSLKKVWKQDESKPVSGVAFEIRDSAGKLVQTMTTTDTGQAQSQPLDKGTYTVTEQVPEGAEDIGGGKYRAEMPGGGARIIDTSWKWTAEVGDYRDTAYPDNGGKVDNSYESDNAEVTLHAVKHLTEANTGKELDVEAGQFAFEVYRDEACTDPVWTEDGKAKRFWCDDDGNAVLGKLTYTQAQMETDGKPGRDYTYWIKEADLGAEGTTYEAEPARVDVHTGYEIGKGARATAQYHPVGESDGTAGDDPSVFEDTVEHGGYIKVAKTDPDGEALPGAQFTVTNASGKTVSYGGKSYGAGQVAATITTGDDGTATTGKLPLGTYKVTETKAPNGYLVNKDWTGEAVIDDDGETADLTGEPCEDPVEPVEVHLEAQKVTKGKKLAAGQFAFELLDASGNTITDDDGQPVRATNDASGKVHFEHALVYDTMPAGDSETRTYLIREVVPDEPDPGWDYDRTTVVATVTITKKQGRLAASVDYGKATGTVGFDANGGDGGSMSQVTMTSGADEALPLCKYTRTGYEFAGWSTEPDGSGDTYADGAAMTGPDNGGHVTLYAQWTKEDQPAMLAKGSDLNALLETFAGRGISVASAR